VSKLHASAGDSDASDSVLHRCLVVSTTYTPRTDTARFIEQLLADRGKHAKLQKKVTASILRDTFVFRSLRQGIPLADVLRKVGLSERTWEDAKHKYELLARKAI